MMEAAALSPSAPLTSCSVARRPVRVGSDPQNDPSDAFVFLWRPREFAKW